MSDARHPFAFPRHLRLSAARDFAAAYAAQTRRPAGPLLIFARPNELGHSRLGLSVGRRVGSAPIRSRIKRLLREAFRLGRHELPGGYDLLIVVRKHAPLPLAEYRTLLATAATKLDAAWRRRGTGADGPAGPIDESMRP